MKLPRSFYLPNVPTTTVDCTGTNLEIHTYERDGVPYAIGFSGSGSKPFFHTRYTKPEARATQIQGYIQNSLAAAKEKADRAAARKEYTHNLSVGDILEGSWGYDQTNVEFYEVIEIVSDKTVKIREIAQESVTNSTVKPRPGVYTGPVLKKLITHGGSAKINSSVSVYKWDGSPCYQTPANCGH